jgi:L-lysine 2,3-aminomutase
MPLRPSPIEAVVSLAQLHKRVIDFLEHYCDRPLVPASFVARVPGRTGEERLDALLDVAGYAGRTDEFLEELAGTIRTRSSDEAGPVVMGGVELPYQLLVTLSEDIIGESGYKTVKKVAQLEKLLNVEIAGPDERDDLQRVIDTYPVRLSWHVIRQMRFSRAIGHQYRPFAGELDAEGEVHTWVGQFHRGILEQMYANRVIFIMNMACPTYCRFCFRKHKECRNQRPPTKTHVKQDIAYLRESERIKEIVLTGGDPFMNRATLQYAVAELAKIPHIQTLRLASRAVAYHPALFLRDDAYWLDYLIKANLDLQQKGKRLELATHLLHPDELSADTLHIISHLCRHGVPVYVQTPFVAGCNENGPELVELFTALRAAGAEIHYVFMPTSPIQGNKVYWSSIAKGLEAARYLRAHLSDRAMPHVTTATSIGKIDWNTSGWVVGRHERDPRYIWIRTPYTTAYFQEFAPILQMGDEVRSNEEGGLDARFLAEVGDDALLAGPRGLTSSPQAFEYKLATTARTVAASFEGLRARSLVDQRLLDVSIGATPNRAVARSHKTRAEVDAGASDAELDAALDYVRARPEITDVVVSRREGLLRALSFVLDLVERIQRIPHVTAVRLRCLELLATPDLFTRPVTAKLAERNRLAVVRPCRLEIETQVLRAEEIRAPHRVVVRQLARSGITVYNHTPLLGHVNDHGEEMLKIAYACREAGIEMSHVVVAGLPLQDDWSADHPVEANAVIDIATHVRRLESGRAVPRYVVRTRLGEIDFGIVPRVFVADGDTVRVCLRPHDLDYFRAIDPDFVWPVDVTTDADGHPLVPVRGVTLENQEFLYLPAEA